MKKFIIKFNKPIAVLTAVMLLGTAIPISILGIRSKNVNAQSSFSSGDMITAGDISNMTGVSVKNILELKSQGKTWNEILESLKQKSSSIGSKQSAMNQLLAQDEFDDSFIKKLEKEGFSDTDIMEARMLVERVVFELNEITPGADTEKYLELSGKINEQTAVYLMLKLKNDFGSIEKVLDEYLCSLQLGIDLEGYLLDRQAYLDQKDKKTAGINMEDIITIQKIDEKATQKIQENNLKAGGQDSSATKSQENGAVPNPSTIVPKPDVRDVKPVNPAEKIEKEIDALLPDAK